MYTQDYDSDGVVDFLMTTGDSIYVLYNDGPLGDVNKDRQLSIEDVDALCRSIRDGDQEMQPDLNSDNQVDQRDVEFLAETLLGTVMGDVNGDGVFSSSDLVRIFQAGEYEDGEDDNSLWTDGDWNCDVDSIPVISSRHSSEGHTRPVPVHRPKRPVPEENTQRDGDTTGR